VKFSIFRPIEGRPRLFGREESRQQEFQPSKQEMEVITGGGQHGVNGIAGMVCKIIAAHAVFGLKMTDHWFDGGAPPQLTASAIRVRDKGQCRHDRSSLEWRPVRDPYRGSAGQSL
jgi:hypothetical protein